MTDSGAATLVFLSLNEVDALRKLLPLVPRDLFASVIAVDAGSTDGTLDLYREAGIPVHIQAERGRGKAFVWSLDLVTTPYVVFLSADGNEDPADLSAFLRALRAGFDMVVGGRFILAGSQTDMSDDPLGLRKAGAIAFGVLVRVLYRSGVWDSTNGYRGFRVESMRRMRLDAAGHAIEFQSTIRATKLGMKIKEIPTHELTRMGGERKETAGTWRLGSETLRCLVRELALGQRFLSDSVG
jgi:glycosyltransferase involved in cell wall biosynthesis